MHKTKFTATACSVQLANYPNKFLVHCSHCFVITVPYHEDQCTKNKRMFQNPTHSLFLTCTDNFFFFAHTKSYWRVRPFGKIKIKKENTLTYLEVGPFPWWRIPILSGPLLKVNCLAPFALPSPPTPASRQNDIYLHTDNINKPASLVGHSNIPLNKEILH